MDVKDNIVISQMDAKESIDISQMNVKNIFTSVKVDAIRYFCG
jgi:hypothetical protein